MAATSPTTLLHWHTTVFEKKTRKMTRLKMSRMTITTAIPISTIPSRPLSGPTLAVVITLLRPTRRTLSWGHREWPGGSHVTSSRRVRREDTKRMDSPEVLELCRPWFCHKQKWQQTYSVPHSMVSSVRCKYLCEISIKGEGVQKVPDLC